MAIGIKQRGVRVLLAAALLAPALAAVTGCGNSTADKFRARAISRPPEDEATPAPKRPAAPPAAEPTGTPPAPADATAPAGAVAAQVATAEPADAAPAAPPLETTLPTTPQGRVEWTKENLERIGAAMQAYLDDKGGYPSVAIADVSRKQLLSWRVALLPYLGYGDLYKQFDTRLPWDAPQNKRLLSSIPREYQSPERGDSRTNYLAPYGSTTIFQKLRTLLPLRVDDGLENTAMVVEVDDALATEWTRPQEYEVDYQNPQAGLGSLRGGRLFLVWGGGGVGAIALSNPPAAFKAVFTADGGERYTRASLDEPIDPTWSGDPVVGAAPAVAAAAPGGASVSSPGQPAPTARGRQVAAGELAGKYREAAEAAFLDSDPTAAWKWSTAWASIGGAPPAAFAWYPALKRPALGVHFAIGVASDTDAPSRGARRGNAAPSRATLEDRTAPYGELLLDVIEKHAVDSSISKLLDPAEAPARRARTSGFDPAAAITVLEPGDATVLRREAEAAGCDVLVLLEVEENQQRTRRTLRLSLLDIAGRAELFESRRLAHSALQDTRGEPAADPTLKQARWDLQDLLEDGLSPHDWPVRLTEQLARRRVASLGKSRDPFPPRVAAEIAYYRSLRLVDDAEALAALEALLGDEAGANLLLGDESKQKRVLREWLPATHPSEQIARAGREGVKSDDR